MGTHGPAPEERGGWADLTHESEVVGAVLRTRARVSPVFVSAGQHMDVASATAIVLATTLR